MCRDQGDTVGVRGLCCLCNCMHAAMSPCSHARKNMSLGSRRNVKACIPVTHVHACGQACMPHLELAPNARPDQGDVLQVDDTQREGEDRCC